jgi:hypothetical protein
MTREHAAAKLPTPTTRRLLFAGVVAGPLYITVAAAQALTRTGFDLSRHPVSLLSNGDLGWIQIANFVVAGLLTVAASVGMQRAIGSRPGGTWGPRLLAVYGLSVLAAGLLVADPGAGFPPGTPEVGEVSWHGLGHFLAGGIGFPAMAAACIVLARPLSGSGRSWTPFSVATGVVLLATYGMIASGGGATWTILAFTGGVVLVWLWLTAAATRAGRNLPEGTR